MHPEDESRHILVIGSPAFTGLMGSLPEYVGQSGSGAFAFLSEEPNEQLFLTLRRTLRETRPRGVLVGFCSLAQRYYRAQNQEQLLFDPGLKPSDTLVRKDVWKHFSALSNPIDDGVYFFRIFSAVAALLGRYRWAYLLASSKQAPGSLYAAQATNCIGYTDLYIETPHTLLQTCASYIESQGWL